MPLKLAVDLEQLIRKEVDLQAKTLDQILVRLFLMSIDSFFTGDSLI